MAYNREVLLTENSNQSANTNKTKEKTMSVN